MEVSEIMEYDPVILETFPYDNEILMNSGDPVGDIFKTLKSSVQGLAVLNYYKHHRTLNDFYRNFLSDTIILTEMRSNQNLMYFKFLTLFLFFNQVSVCTFWSNLIIKLFT